MRERSRKLLGLLAGCGLTLAGGCGGGATAPANSSTAETSVHGTVKVRGKAIDNGYLEFDPTNINRPTAPIAKAEIGKDGRYTAKTLVGPNNVTVQSRETRGDSTLQSPVFLDAQAGENTLDIELPPPVPK